MPQRFLRPGITTSIRFNRLSLLAQNLFTRLITLVDDYGRFEAHSTLLRSLAFPMSPEITLEQINEACQAMSDAGMIIFYECEGVRYLQITRWKERVRAESRFPDPSADICQRVADICQTTPDKCSPPKPVAISHKPSPEPAPAPTAACSGEKGQGRAAPAPPASRFPRPTLDEWLDGVIPDDDIRAWSRDYWESKFHSAGQRHWYDWRNQEIRDWRAYREFLAVKFRNEHAQKLDAMPKPTSPDFLEKRRAEQAEEEARQGRELLEALQQPRE